MSLQHRPLSGMTPTPATGATPPLAIPAAPVAAAIIHQIDTTTIPTNFLDQVTLFLLNAGATDQTVRLTALGIAMDVRVPAGEITRPFVDQPFFGVPGNPGASQITVQNISQPPEPVFAYGFFTR